MIAPSSPYKGLSAFEDSELDALLFFGRERENEVVASNLIASRLTVLYGPSGVGKSSLLKAAVARTLRRLPEKPLVVVFSRWSEDPAEALAETIVGLAGEDGADGDALGALDRVQSTRDVYLVLDQAEEYFLYHADDRGPGSFAELLPAILSAPSRVNVLVSLREDSLAKLDRFTGQIPGLFANTLRLDRLSREAAGAAILRPLQRYAELTGGAVDIEPQLTERVLNEVGTGRIEPALTGRGVIEQAPDGARIEAPYLQLVMQRLWSEERSKGSLALTLATLERLGGARRIVEEHLEGAMAELTDEQKDVAARLFEHLVTPSGTKIAHEEADLANFGNVSHAELEPVLATLTERRVLRSLEEDAGVRYEVFHDVLAQPVLAWRAVHQADRTLAAERADARRRQRRLVAVIAVGAVLVAALTGISAFALAQRSEAEKQAASAQAAEASAERQAALAEAERVEADRQRVEAERQRAKAEQAEQKAKDEAANAAEARQQAEANARSAEQSADEADAARRAAVQSATEAGQAQSLAETQAQKARVERARAEVEEAEARAQKGKAEEAEARARSAAQEAEARELAHRSLTLLAVRPVASLRLALRAAEQAPRLPLVESALRSALAGSRVRAVLPGGGGPVTGASFSPDGKLALTVASRARIFDVRTGAPLRTLPDPVSVRAAAFSPAGRLAATGGSDGVGRVWEIRPPLARLGAERRPIRLRGHAKAIETLSFSQDGALLVTGSNDRTAMVWRTATGERVSVLRHEGPVTSARFSPDADLVVTVSRVAKTGRLLARLFDARSGRDLVTLDARGVRSAIFSPDGSLVVTTGNDDRVRVWSPETGKSLAVLTHDEDVVGAAFSPDGTQLAAASAGGAAFIWDVETWTREHVLTGPLNPVTAVSFSPDGRFLLVSSRDRTARVYRANNGLEIAMLAGHRESVVAASYAPDGRKVLTASLDGTARLWDPGTRDLLQLVGRRNGGPIRTAAISPDGRLAVSAGADGTARILLVAERRQLQVLRHGAGVNDAQFNPEGTLVLTASEDHTSRLWRLDGRLVRTFPHDVRVLRALFSPDGTQVATVGADRAIRIWRTGSGQLVRTLRGHRDAVLDVAFSPDGRLLATGADNGDKRARVWLVEQGRLLHTFRHRGPVASVSFSPDGRLLATASGDELARLWDVRTGRLVRRLAGHTEFVRDAQFSPSGRLVVTASDDHDARIWSVATGETVKILRGHLRGPQTASFSANGRWVVTSGGIAAGLWDTGTGHFFAPTGLAADPFLRGHAIGPLTTAVLAPGGRRVLTAGADGTVRTYFCRMCGGVEELIRLSSAHLARLEKTLSAAERRRYLYG